MNRVTWNMRPAAAGGGGGRGGFGAQAPALPPGDYAITVAVGAQEQKTVGRIRARMQ